MALLRGQRDQGAAPDPVGEHAPLHGFLRLGSGLADQAPNRAHFRAGVGRHRSAGRERVDLLWFYADDDVDAVGGYPSGRREGCGRARRPAVGRARRVGRRSRRLRDLSRRAERLTRCGDPSARGCGRRDARMPRRWRAAVAEEGAIATEPPVDLDARAQRFKDAIEGEGLGAKLNSRCGPTSRRPAAGSRSGGGHVRPRAARGTWRLRDRRMTEKTPPAAPRRRGRLGGGS